MKFKSPASRSASRSAARSTSRLLFKMRLPGSLRASQHSPSTKAEDWSQRTLNFLKDKDARLIFGWLSSGFGLLIIGGYYLWLGFTPAFGIGQATLLLMQAVLIGAIVTGYFAAMLFFPAVGYRVLKVEIDAFPRERQQAAIAALTLRSIAAQAAFLSMLFLVFIVKYFDLEGNAAVYALSCCVIFLCSAVILLNLPRTTTFGGSESRTDYVWSLLILGAGGVMAVWMLVTLYSLPTEKERVETGYFVGGLVAVVVISAVLSTLRKKHRIGGMLFGVLAYAVLLVIFNSGSMPFRATAVALGIAASGPVELIFPPTTCQLVKPALSNQNSLPCDGPEAGQLKGVLLMNTLGDRWVIREPDHVENIIFDGKGMVVRIPAKKRKQSD